MAAPPRFAAAWKSCPATTWTPPTRSRSGSRRPPESDRALQVEKMPVPRLPSPMIDLRPELGAAVAKLEQRSPYAAVLLSSREGISIEVEQQEEKISQLPLSAGIVVTCQANGILMERSLPGFEAGRLEQAGRALPQELPAAQNRTPAAEGGGA